jgi:hypothetical protein
MSHSDEQQDQPQGRPNQGTTRKPFVPPELDPIDTLVEATAERTFTFSTGGS